MIPFYLLLSYFFTKTASSKADNFPEKSSFVKGFMLIGGKPGGFCPGVTDRSKTVVIVYNFSADFHLQTMDLFVIMKVTSARNITAHDVYSWYDI